MLQIVGGIALLFYVGWLAYLGARSSVHVRAMAPSRQATFVLYCVAVCSAILCIGAVSLMNYAAPTTSSADVSFIILCTVTFRATSRLLLTCTMDLLPRTHLFF